MSFGNRLRKACSQNPFWGREGKKEKVFFAYKKEGFEVLCCVVAAVAVAAAFLRAKRF